MEEERERRRAKGIEGEVEREGEAGDEWERGTKREDKRRGG